MFKSITAVAVSAAALFAVRPPSPVGASAVAQRDDAAVARTSTPRTAPDDVLGGFVENRGQWHSDARFAARFGRAWTFVTNEGLRVTTPDTYGRAGAAVFLTFDGARPAEIRGEGAKPGRFNFFRGGDPGAWRTDVPVFAGVRVVDAWRGVDVVVRERDGRLAYDVELAPGARLSDVVVRVEGADAPRVEGDGVLVVDTAAGPLRQSEPVAWRTGRDGARTPVRVVFRALGADRFGFAAEGDVGDGTDPLTVDPSLDWCGFVGGNNLDETYAVDLDPAGNVYLGGRSASPDFPVTPGAYDISGTTGNFDAVVVKLDPTASTLLYGSFFGGSGTDRVEALCVNAAGEAHFTGQGGSAWPTTPGAFDTVYGGQGDMYAAKLSANGATLAFSTFVGGAAEERGHAIALDAAGAVYVAGQTLSTTSYPTTSSAILATSDSANTWNACLTKVNPSGASLAYSVKFGGAASEWIYGLRVDATGAAYVSGATSSANFFTTAGALNLVGVSLDTFVAKVNPSGASYAWCARVGGPGVDQSFGGALGADGTFYAVGVAGVGFPTTVGAHRTVGDGGDGFAYRLAANGGSLLYSTYLGGTSTDQANCAALDAFGRLYVGGHTNSVDLPVPNAIDATFNGGGAPADGFVAKLAANGATLDYGSYFGGANDDTVLGMRLPANGVLWVVGTTLSPEIAAGGGFGQVPGASYDGFAAKMTLPKSAGSVPFGTGVGVGPAPTLVCAEPKFDTAALASGVSAPPNAFGLLSLSAEIAPLDLGGGYVLYGDPYAALAVGFPVPDAGGAWSASLPFVPTVPALEGVSLALQAFFLEPAAPLGFVASNAVRVTFGF